MSREPEFMASSGNVFTDLRLADAGTWLAEAELARSMTAIIQERGLTQREGA